MPRSIALAKSVPLSKAMLLEQKSKTYTQTFFMKKKKVFLGGTCNQSTWRASLIPQLQIDYFNPVVPVWTQEAYEEELRQRATCDYCLYVITAAMQGVYSIAEVVDDSNKHPSKTIFCFLEEGFNEHQLKSLKAVGKMVEANGAYWFPNLEEVILFLNQNTSF